MRRTGIKRHSAQNLPHFSPGQEPIYSVFSMMKNHIALLLFGHLVTCSVFMEAYTVMQIHVLRCASGNFHYVWRVLFFHADPICMGSQDVAFSLFQLMSKSKREQSQV